MRALIPFLIFTISVTHGATIAYWNIPELDDDTLTDLVGGDQNLVGSNNSVNQSGINVATLPLSNPDPTATAAAGSIYFNGPSGSREAPHLDAAGVFQMTSTSSFTMEGWIRADSGATGYIASDRHRGNSFRGWFIELTGSGGIQFYSNSGGVQTTINSASITDSASHHFAAVWDHTTSEMSLYVDGSMVGSPQSHAVGTYSVFGFSIGGRHNDTGDLLFQENMLTAGVRLDELRFSDQALNSSEFLNAIPEPSTALLSLLGLIPLLRRRR